MTVDEVAVRPPAEDPDAEPSSGRLVVAWQHPDSRLIAPVGVLDRVDGQNYRFRYLRRAADVAGFRPFLGFPNPTDEYRSPRLFPLFAQRVMSDRRPDFQRYLQQLHLGSDALPWDQMARSEGRRTGDTVQVFPVPFVRADGSTSSTFFVHGVRHVNGGALPPLAVGEELAVLPEPANPVNPAALLVCSTAGERIGYIPDLLLDHVRAMRSSGLVVEHVNGPEVPAHLRLLVRLDGHVPPGYRPMAGPGWELFVE